MAKSMNFRTFSDGGDPVCFSSLKFRTEFDRFVNQEKEEGRKCTKESIFNIIAEKACVSVEAVKKWRLGHNGPSDLDTIKKVASVLKTDYHNLIVSGDNGENRTIERDFVPMSGEEKDLINQMYQLFVDYGYWFFGNESCYADKVLENPMDEQQKYIINLYHFLDRIALSITRETYGNLRRIITQLDQIYSAYHGEMPALWVELNPLIGTEMFYALRTSDSEDIESFLTDECNENPQEILHMLFEDMPEYEKEYKKNLKDKRLKSYFNRVENSLPGQRNWYFYYPLYTLISRELCNTLFLVMEYSFPRYIKENGKEK